MKKALLAVLLSGAMALSVSAGAGAASHHKTKHKKAAHHSTTTTTKAPKISSNVRKVTGKLVTLGAGTFTGGVDVVPGLYDVTAGAGQSGNFIVQGTDSYDEILGAVSDDGVPTVRAKISKGDKIQLSGLSQVTFNPVTSPYVTTHSLVNLYAGNWTVGQDVGPGRYVATPIAGQSGNFIIEDEDVDEILGDESDGGVPSVTFTVKKGDIIQVSGISQVTLTPK